MNSTSWVIVGAIWGWALGQLLCLGYETWRDRRRKPRCARCRTTVNCVCVRCGRDWRKA